MTKNLVRDWMTRDPITTSPESTLPQARKLMSDFCIRRLPVVESGNLVGIVTLGDIRQAEPSDATTLSVNEIHYLLAKLTIREIMTREPITIAPDTTIRQAAKIMLDNKIAGLPVVESDRVVGIITESDIFQILVQQPELTPENLRNAYPNFEQATG